MQCICQALSTFVDLEMLTKGSEKLVWFCFDYLPSSIEIIDPQHIRYSGKEFSKEIPIS